MVTSKSRRFICACQFVDPKLNSSVSMQNYSLNIVYYSHWSHFCSLFSPWIMLLTLMKLKSSGSVVKKPHASAWDRIRSLGREDPLEEEMATHSRILAWRILWTEEPRGLQSTHRVTKSRIQLKWHSTYCGLPVMKLQSQTYWNLVIIWKVTVSKLVKSKILESKYHMIIPIWVFSFFRLKLNSIGEKHSCAWLWGWVVIVS